MSRKPATPDIRTLPVEIFWRGVRLRGMSGDKEKIVVVSVNLTERNKEMRKAITQTGARKNFGHLSLAASR